MACPFSTKNFRKFFIALFHKGLLPSAFFICTWGLVFLPNNFHNFVSLWYSQATGNKEKKRATMKIMYPIFFFVYRLFSIYLSSIEFLIHLAKAFFTILFKGFTKILMGLMYIVFFFADLSSFLPFPSFCRGPLFLDGPNLPYGRCTHTIWA